MNKIVKGSVAFSIVIEGRETPIYTKDGAYWIEGTPGKPYTIRVANQSYRPVLVLESVDGRNVLLDEPASLQNHGMVVKSIWDNYGWRIDDDTTRDFVFTDPSSSIAAQATGEATGVGVIGIAVYQELSRAYYTASGTPAPMWMNNARSMLSSDVAGEVKSMLSADLGTGMGQARDSHVGHTTFERDERTLLLIEVQYRTREWLLENGIIAPQLPRAFNTTTGYNKYRLEG